MKKIVFSAPGSIILSGGALINFGRPALTMAISPRVKTIITEAEKLMVKDTYITEAIKIVQNHFEKNNISYKDKSFDLQVESDIPKEEKFGYSSSLLVAIIASLFFLYSDRLASQEEIALLAYQLEKKLIKKTYGIRTSVSSFGGLIYFRKEFEFLRTTSLLNIKVPKNIERHLMIIDDTGIENIIGKNYNINPEKTDKVLFELEKITKRMVLSFIKEDSSLYQDCLRRERELLSSLNKKNSLLKMEKIPFSQDIKGVICEQR